MQKQQRRGVGFNATDDVAATATGTREILPALLASALPVPASFVAAGDKASEHFLEFFAVRIRNKNTRAACVQAARVLYDTDPRTTNLYDRLSKTYLLAEMVTTSLWSAFRMHRL